jgi:hypothetical protein
MRVTHQRFDYHVTHTIHVVTSVLLALIYLLRQRYFYIIASTGFRFSRQYHRLITHTSSPVRTSYPQALPIEKPDYMVQWRNERPCPL